MKKRVIQNELRNHDEGRKEQRSTSGNNHNEARMEQHTLDETENQQDTIDEARKEQPSLNEGRKKQHTLDEARKELDKAEKEQDIDHESEKDDRNAEQRTGEEEEEDDQREEQHTDTESQKTGYFSGRGKSASLLENLKNSIFHRSQSQNNATAESTLTHPQLQGRDAETIVEETPELKSVKEKGICRTDSDEDEYEEAKEFEDEDQFIEEEDESEDESGEDHQSKTDSEEENESSPETEREKEITQAFNSNRGQKRQGGKIMMHPSKMARTGKRISTNIFKGATPSEAEDGSSSDDESNKHIKPFDMGSDQSAGFKPTRTKSYLCSKLKWIIRNMAGRYRLRHQWKEDNGFENLKEEEFFTSYWYAYGGYWLYDDKRENIVAAAICEIDDHWITITDYDEEDGNKLKRMKRQVLMIHYTTDLSPYLRLLISYICSKHKVKKKYIYVSLHCDDCKRSAMMLRDVVGRDKTKQMLVFYESMKFFELYDDPKPKASFCSKWIKEEYLQFKNQMTTKKMDFINIKNPFPTNKTITDVHIVHGADRQKVSQSIKDDYKRLFKTYYPNIDLKKTWKMYDVTKYLDKSQLAMWIDEYPTEEYVPYGYRDDEHGLRIALFRHNPSMGWFPIPFSHVCGGDAVVKNVRRGRRRVRRGKVRYCTVKGNVTGSTGSVQSSHSNTDIKCDSIDAINHSCAWLSLLAMMKDPDPIGYQILVRLFNADPTSYQSMSIFSKTKGNEFRVRTLSQEITKRPLSYRIWKIKLKGDDGNTWLSNKALKGYFICHLKSITGQSTHGVGLTRYGDGTGKVYDSVFKEYDFDSRLGLANFDNVFPNEFETIKELEIVAEITIPERRVDLK